MICEKCGIEFYSLNNSKRKICWSCLKELKGKSKVKIIREETKKQNE